MTRSFRQREFNGGVAPAVRHTPSSIVLLPFSPMPISVTCACGTRLRARDESAGKTIRCPKCGAGIEVPTVPAEVPAPEAADERPAASRPFAPRSVPARERSVRFGQESDGRDLRMEAHFRAIALWWRIYG